MPYRLCSVLLILFISIFFVIFHPAYANECKDVAKVEDNRKLSLDYAKDVFSTYHMDRSNIDRSMEIANKIVDNDPGNVEALIFLSRVWLTYGYVTERTKEGKIRAFEQGMEIAISAIGIEPENPDAHFFYVANLALMGQNKGIFNSLFMLPEIKGVLDRILELDPNHVYALGMQGALYYYLPGILGGDMQISEIYLRRALFSDPHLSSAKLYLAMNLKKQKRYDEAIVLLNELISEKDPSFYPDWYLNRNFAVILRSRIQKQRK